MRSLTRLRPRPTAKRRRRGIVASAIVVVIVGLLLGNAAMVDGQDADATGNSSLPVDGGNIYTRQVGPRDAPVLVLIHGLGGSTRWWDWVVPMLATPYRVIRIDLLGHGRSAKPAGGDYAIPQQARRVGQVLDRLGITHAIVVGHSTGGYVATSLAEQRGGLVTALALIDTGLRMDGFISDGPVGKLVFAPVLGQLLWRLRTDGIIRKSMSTAFAPGFKIPQELVGDTRAMTYHALTAQSRASDDYLNQRPVPDRLAGLAKPLLVIFGEQDQRWHSSSAACTEVFRRRESSCCQVSDTLPDRGSAADRRTSPQLHRFRTQPSVTTCQLASPQQSGKLGRSPLEYAVAYGLRRSAR